MHEQWTDFFVAETGAAAALTGLFFVAISINVAEIARDANLPGRAAETIAMLTGALLMASLMLVPDQETPWLGLELAAVAAITWLVPVRFQLAARSRLSAAERGTFPMRVLLSQVATVPSLVAASFLAAGSSVGYAVLALGLLVIFVVSIASAWVLLIEIKR
jgi:modulator of FtsH protease